MSDELQVGWTAAMLLGLARQWSKEVADPMDRICLQRNKQKLHAKIWVQAMYDEE